MVYLVPQPSALKLSICIPTFNRAAFIGATLESIVAQMTEDCEIIVLDGASTDETERVVSEYTRHCDRLRYVRQETNNGFDRDCDRAVELAQGEYCWLMTDDDLLKAGAVAAVLHALRRDVSLIIINAESWDYSMSTLVWRRLLHFESDRVYGPRDMDSLFVEVGGPLNCNSVLIKRAIWLARERQRYYGSWFIHVGVIFQERLPSEALVMAKPLIKYRRGNTHMYSSQLIEVLFAKWPAVAASLTLSESARKKVYSVEPWRNPQWLLWLRGAGYYSLTEYRQWIRPHLHSIPEAAAPILVALVPGVLINALLLLYWTVTGNSYQGKPSEVWLQGLRESRTHFRNWRVLKRNSAACRHL